VGAASFQTFYLVVILYFENKILMYIARNTSQFAERSRKQFVTSFLMFHLAACASQVGSGLPLTTFASQAGSL
jgi:hypothetical protein